MCLVRLEGTGKSENAVSRPDEVSRHDSQTTPSFSLNRKTPPNPSAFSKQIGVYPASSNSLTVTSPEGPAPMTATRLDTHSPPSRHTVPSRLRKVKYFIQGRKNAITNRGRAGSRNHWMS